MSNLKVNTINDASGGNAAKLYGVSMRDGGTAFVNRIINGDMRIDQRNAGAAVLNAANYVVDRWADFKAGSGGYTAQRSTTAPSGFTNSFQHTVTTAVSPAAGDVYQIFQLIEGYNTADLAFGTAAAQAVTVSFWARSSVTGLYAFRLQNSNASRTYVATYTVNASNTWEYKTVTIPGDTSGTWLTDNGIGIGITFDLGSGSSQNGTAGAWAAVDARRTSACVSLIATNGATFYITGVQLEAGTVASPFERRDYGRELMMCQRYLPAFISSNTLDFVSGGFVVNSTIVTAIFPFQVTPRTPPTGISVSSAAHFTANTAGGGGVTSAVAFSSAGLFNCRMTFTSASMTTGQACEIFANTASGKILFTGCEL